MTNKNLILHIPHSSVKIPFYDGFITDEKLINEEQLILTDWHTDDLFDFHHAITVNADFSRIFCDVERFADDAVEVMAEKGMGGLYEKRDNLNPLRTVSPELRIKILDTFYYPHHKKFSDAVINQLQKYGNALIIDCHSFSNIPFNRDINKTPNRPDINIGTDNYHTSEKLILTASNFFKEKNLTIGINTPYSGTIVPIEHYNKNCHVQSIMIEINRKLYLEPNSNIKSGNYDKIKKTITTFLEYFSKIHSAEV